MRDRSTSTVSTGVNTTTSFAVKSGIKQGCPFNGLRFNFAIDYVIWAVQVDTAEHRVLAFADDLCLTTDSPAELQAQLDTTTDRLARMGLRLNPEKCVSVHFSGRTLVRVQNTTFKTLT